ncbi:regulatory iron-sulfur-containing complex subunit RicT [Flavitalea sp.]|nr:regulatory iron-sulfur-containing complex subunit RicT [Flavitalea sp.]
MGCSSCGTGAAGGKVSGCQSNGGCSTGGCNRMNTYDWLANLPLSSAESSCRVVEISFNNGSRKDYFRNSTVQIFDKGDMVTVEGISGFDVGEISLTGEVVRIQLKKKGLQEQDAEMKKLLRRSTDKDLELLQQNKAREKEALIRARAISKQLNLNMKVSEVEFQADGRKATFFYIADDRVDFRELIKIYAKEFKVKVEMRQIGARQEAAKVGGIGSCGRELCCSTWLTDFKSVNTTAARYQNLSINQSKLSGQCGRLKCCLNYELDTYLDALQGFPDNADTIQVAKGTAILIKKDIFKNLMWYILPDSSKQYPLAIERVKKIKQLNQKGEIPQELEPADLTPKAREIEPEYADLVGQISLKTLEKAEKKKKFTGPGSGQQGHGPQQSQQPRPNQQQPAKPQQPRGNAQGPKQPNQKNGPQKGQQPKRPPQQGRAQQGPQQPQARPQQQSQPRQPQQRLPLQKSQQPNESQSSQQKPGETPGPQQNPGPRQSPPQSGNDVQPGQ